MLQNPEKIARMIDLSCVRTNTTQSDIEDLAQAAIKYGFGQVSVLQSFVPLTKTLLNGHPEIRLVGNVSFPSGSDSSTIKVAQAKELAAMGCDEIDMVMNVGQLLSGDLESVEMDIRGVISAVKTLPVKVIIEIMYLEREDVRSACEICVQSGAAFIKTGTGWAPRGTSLEDVELIRSFVGDQINIKASGGIRDLATLIAMVQAGATRFGVNLQSGVKIVTEALEAGSQAAG